MSFPSAPEWIEALEAAATEVVSHGGGSDLPEFEAGDAAAPGGGAFISLMGPGHSVRLGVVGSTPALKRLAAMLTQEEPADDELKDATCELANVLAGNVRKLLSARVPELTLGLPVYSTQAPALERYQVARSALKLPDLSAELWVMMPKAAVG
ncbi:MAG: chemotaxis protein CheX [Archangiaceae bacterium]|nr:chemotaxis protein CheX [Archangiaceae bacterium]